jgi:ParB-like chromosome segregation protein Spo0J
MPRIPIKNITIGRCFGGLDRKKVTRYRQALRRRDKFPPIDVERYGPGRYGVQDGFHRFRALRLEGRKTIKIMIRIDYK